MVCKESFSFHSSYEKILLQKLDERWWANKSWNEDKETKGT